MQQIHTNNQDKPELNMHLTRPAQTGTILEVKDLHVEFKLEERMVRAVNGVSFKVEAGQSVGVVGESGCGKSVTSYAIMQTLAKNGKITKGEVWFDSQRMGGRVNLLEYKATGEEMRGIRGSEIGMIFQEPMTAFSPVHKIGDQITDVMLLHTDMTKVEARERAIELLVAVGIPNAADRIDDYTFQFSGGMRQRAMIAMALACNPALLIADEPTTALDVTMQAQVLRQIKMVQEQFGLALILITHDLGVIAQTVSFVYVMYLGRVVEEGPVEEIFYNPQHPYTMDLLKSIPRATGDQGRLAVIRGSVPNYLPRGCPFHTRCTRIVGDQCKTTFPEPTVLKDGHVVRCHLYEPTGGSA